MTQQSDDFESFARAVYQRLPNEWNTQFDPKSDVTADKTGGGKASFRRDDLIGIILEYGTNETWPPEQILVQVAQDDMAIPDMPGQNVVRDSIAVDADAVAQFIQNNAPEYAGSFEYDH